MAEETIVEEAERKEKSITEVSSILDKVKPLFPKKEEVVEFLTKFPEERRALGLKRPTREIVVSVPEPEYKEYMEVRPVEERAVSGSVSVTHPSGYHPLSGLTDEEIERFSEWSKKFFEKHKLTPEQKAKLKEELHKFARGAKSTVLHFIDSLRKAKAKEKMEEVVPLGVGM